MRAVTPFYNNNNKEMRHGINKNDNDLDNC